MCVHSDCSFVLFYLFQVWNAIIIAQNNWYSRMLMNLPNLYCSWTDKIMLSNSSTSYQVQEWPYCPLTNIIKLCHFELIAPPTCPMYDSITIIVSSIWKFKYRCHSKSLSTTKLHETHFLLINLEIRCLQQKSTF